MAKLYLAGGLFSAGERLHNLFLEKALKDFGHEIILPQRECSNSPDVKPDLEEIAESCRVHCEDPDTLYVGSLDGARADDGGSVEFGITITANGKAVVYRTDFRTALKNQVGVNAMFRLRGAEFVYEPCFFTELSEVDRYYQKLALSIHKAILGIQCKT